MSGWQRLLIDIAIVLILTAGIWQFRDRQWARWGNLTGALALACAVGVALWRDPLESGVVLVAVAFAVGGLIGWTVALRVDMVQIPAMVALQHGCGGAAAALVSYVELARDPEAISVIGLVSGLLGLILGAATFSASMIAAGKLAGRLKGRPLVLTRHNLVLGGLALVTAGAAVTLAAAPDLPVHLLLIALGVLAVALGVVFSVRIGGADMPVLISFLNATAGLAAALVGVQIQNRLLIACGATVAASGSILTAVMCRAMNRPLMNVFTGLKPAAAPAGGLLATAAGAPEAAPAEAPARRAAPADPYAAAADLLRAARTVVIIPGYGMALAHAQFEVAKLADLLTRRGAEVLFAVHPVAGRMPGHMHVLLAEADVDPDTLFEMREVNPRLKDADVAVVVGACDVVNPAAIHSQGTPISGMPILAAHEARAVIVCNLDEKPGYSGVPNTLYDDPRTLLLLGDAQETVAEVVRRLG